MESTIIINHHNTMKILIKDIRNRINLIHILVINIPLIFRVKIWTWKMIQKIKAILIFHGIVTRILDTGVEIGHTCSTKKSREEVSARSK